MNGVTPASAGARRPGWVRAALAGLGEPVVVVLLLIAFFSAIVGKTLSGLLVLLTAAGLGWHTAHTRRQPTAPAGAPAAADAEWMGLPEDQAGKGPVAANRRHRPRMLAGLTAGSIYAWAVGSFTRYSWPATVAVIGLAVIVVTTSWHTPLRPRPDSGRLSTTGTAVWAGLITAGSAWELAAFLQQPSLKIASYAHPTISALTDPLLASHAGRSVALATWLAIGWFLVRR